MEAYDICPSTPNIPKRMEWGLLRTEKKELADFFQDPGQECEPTLRMGMPVEAGKFSSGLSLLSVSGELGSSPSDPMVIEPKKYSRMDFGDYEAYVSASLGLMKDSVMTIVLDARRAESPIPEQMDERERLTLEYQELTERDLSDGLSFREANRLRQIEQQLDEIDSRDPMAVQMLGEFKKDSSKLQELKEIAERLKALL